VAEIRALGMLLQRLAKEAVDGIDRA